ncbi:Rieske 2Fe-2S domain-containing protein [Acaryochloris sp. CCMEE 5410]|uniref:Rieske 2Fe-2S domain-containing protein n=1 Tax=Acaryochloris sp. CCMEE 5410 TaxID=310037 RepID=UPI0002484496|nr:Rieske 2Fe-2S domain-containing protein [Acaryochloris sp. CCMEE 5410]KAI9129157.1 Rieske 2Fe-2S domain-containing protein [Acaryochloris sp. CCMEE 5410]
MTTHINPETEALELNSPKPRSAAVEQPFNWLKQWYPISPLSYLDSTCPTPITILGKKLVVWHHERQWTVMDDICPHKLTQLSLGKIQDDGTLVCRQHGWQFDCSGQCVKIPMLADSDSSAAVYRNVRSHVPTYPTQVAQELLWVWLDCSSAAQEECQQKQPATLPDPSEQWTEAEWHLSDVPVGYTVSLESSLDPSHAQFLHEGIFGFSPATAMPMRDFELEGEMSAEDGFMLRHGGYNAFNQGMRATRRFCPPCANMTQYHLPTGGIQIFQLYFVPTTPGHCRYIGKFAIDTPPPAPRFNFFQWANRQLWGLLPQDVQVGLQHLGAYKLSDQDITAMHAQEQNEAADPEHRRTSFFPTPADQGILTLRTWFKQFAEGGPATNTLYSEGVETTSDEQLYDRWHRHTKLCPSCRHSVDRLANAQKLCQRLAIVSAVLGAVMLLLPILPLRVSLGCLVISIFSLLGYQGLSQLQHRFMSSIPQQGSPKITLYAE